MGGEESLVIPARMTKDYCSSVQRAAQSGVVQCRGRLSCPGTGALTGVTRQTAPLRHNPVNRCCVREGETEDEAVDSKRLIQLHPSRPLDCSSKCCSELLCRAVVWCGGGGEHPRQLQCR